MLRRWNKDVFLTLFMCDLKESVGSMIMPRFLTRGEGVTDRPSMQSEKFWEVGMMVFGPKIIISVLLQLSLRKMWSIQVLMSVRQLVRLDRMAEVMAVVVMCSWVSSA